jgi:hypothetical protein
MYYIQNCFIIIGDRHVKQQSTESFIRYISRRGAPNTVTFSNTDCMPNVLIENNAKIIPNKVL